MPIGIPWFCPGTALVALSGDERLTVTKGGEHMKWNVLAIAGSVLGIAVIAVIRWGYSMFTPPVRSIPL